MRHDASRHINNWKLRSVQNAWYITVIFISLNDHLIEMQPKPLLNNYLMQSVLKNTTTEQGWDWMALSERRVHCLFKERFIDGERSIQNSSKSLKRSSKEYHALNKSWRKGMFKSMFFSSFFFITKNTIRFQCQISQHPPPPPPRSEIRRQ